MRPPYLQEGDKVALITPATKVKQAYVEGAVEYLRDCGLDPVVAPHALGCESGSFAAPLKNRLADLRNALLDRSVKAILCNRGGYGVQQLLPYLSVEEVAANPKWLIGFSDISALHAVWLKAGVESLHAPMAKHLTLYSALGGNQTMDVLFGDEMPVLRGLNPRSSVRGTVSGRLVGGNVAVLNGLASTPFDPFAVTFGTDSEKHILFIEDIGENIYEIDRILTRLYLTGYLSKKVAGIVVGNFSDYAQDLNYSTMEDMISRRLDVMGIHVPMGIRFDFGHAERNMPLISGASAILEATSSSVSLSYQEL